ncbi:DUF7093 family protein [Halohasta salina]|uniref:DUF7093 family protein n=1 Tax=Halohasta salina TaxID=2961621 RepID=UPI0020A2DD89|nr:hypothetical protein [Halohasta salina]
MGLRCLLSHDFGEPELEREREEQGNEVVITVNEVKTCTRCGERRVVSENTEVTSIDQLTDTATAAEGEVAQPAADTDAAGATADVQPGDEPAAEPVEPAAAAAPADTGITIDESTTDDAEIIDDGPADDTEADAEPADLGAAEPDNMTVDDVEAAAAEPVETAGDDGVILDDEPAAEADADDGPASAAASDAEQTADREPGEWPEYDDGDDPAESDRAWPDVEGDDEGFAAEEPPEDGGEDMTFGGGFTPEITETEADGEAELSFTRAEEASVEYEPTVDDIETEFYCPECGFSRLAGDSSMRAGDICPDCKRGYISERPI